MECCGGFPQSGMRRLFAGQAATLMVHERQREPSGAATCRGSIHVRSGLLLPCRLTAPGAVAEDTDKAEVFPYSNSKEGRSTGSAPHLMPLHYNDTFAGQAGKDGVKVLGRCTLIER